MLASVVFVWAIVPWDRRWGSSAGEMWQRDAAGVMKQHGFHMEQHGFMFHVKLLRSNWE
jgi:hypothetical protein